MRNRRLIVYSFACHDTVPTAKGDVLVHGSYQSGIGVLDFSHPARAEGDRVRRSRHAKGGLPRPPFCVRDLSAAALSRARGGTPP